MPRRRRGLDRMMAQRRAQRDAPEIGTNNFHLVKSSMCAISHLNGMFCVFFVVVFLENLDVEVDEDEEVESPQAEERPQATGKVGAKKQRKLEEKQARRAQREVGDYGHLTVFALASDKTAIF